MEKRLLFVFLFVLWINVSLQTSVADKLELWEVEMFQTIFGNSSQSEMIFLKENAINYLESRLSTMVIPVIYIFLILVGIPANVIVLLVLVFTIKEWLLNILSCSLAVSNLFLLLSLGFRVDYHLRGNNWVHGEADCRAVTACFYGNLYASAVTLAFICIFRYLVIMYPIKFCHHKTVTLTVTALMMLGVWVVFVVAIVPELAVKQSYHVSHLDITTCHDVLPLNDDSYNFLLPYNLVLIVLFLLVPLVVNVVCYTRIICKLNKLDSIQRKRLINFISFTLVIFLLCFTPAAVLNLIHYVQVSVSNDDGSYVGFNVAVCLCCLHACIDPLYIFRSKSTRSIFKRQTIKRQNVDHIGLRKN